MSTATEVVMEEEREKIVNNVLCLLTDPDGTPYGAPIYLPQDAGPQQLQQIVNKLLNNEEKLPYAFYISDQELLVPLETYLHKNKGFKTNNLILFTCFFIFKYYDFLDFMKTW